MRRTGNSFVEPATFTAACGTSGLIEGNPAQMINQIQGIVIVFVYDAVVSLILLKIIDAVIGLRVSDEVEREGLDLALHGEVVQ